MRTNYFGGLANEFIHPCLEHACEARRIAVGLAWALQREVDHLVTSGWSTRSLSVWWGVQIQGFVRTLAAIGPVAANEDV